MSSKSAHHHDLARDGEFVEIGTNERCQGAPPHDFNDLGDGEASFEECESKCLSDPSCNFFTQSPRGCTSWETCDGMQDARRMTTYELVRDASGGAPEPEPTPEPEPEGDEEELVFQADDQNCRTPRRLSETTREGSLEACLAHCMDSPKCRFVAFAGRQCTAYEECDAMRRRRGSVLYAKVPKTPTAPTEATTTTTTTTAATTTDATTATMTAAETTAATTTDTTAPTTTKAATTTAMPATTATPTTATEASTGSSQLVMPFPVGTRCSSDNSALLLSLVNVTVHECMEACSSRDGCSFADFEPSLVGEKGFCRVLTSCDETHSCSGNSVVIFQKVRQGSFDSPQWMMTCPSPKVPVLTTHCMTEMQYDLAVQSVKDLFAQLDKTCTADACQEADFGGCILRMAGHDLMDFNGTGDGRGGSDACTDMDDADNAGLPECLFRGEFDGLVSLNDAYQLFCDQISLADFIVIAAEAVMQHLAFGETKPAFEQGFKNNFRFGRTTAFEGCEFAEGVLPSPADSCVAVERVFLDNMGLNWEESAALMGVHTLGRAELKHSGYDGWWTTPENSRRFDNSYFVNMLAGGWCEELNVNGCDAEGLSAGECVEKHQWKRCDKGMVESGLAHEMMLNSDLCLAYLDQEGGDGQLRAGEDHCCAWVHTNVAKNARINRGDFDVSGVIRNNGNLFCNQACNQPLADGSGLYECGKDSRGQSVLESEACCALGEGAPDCRTNGLSDARGPGGPAVESVRRFAEDELFWALTFVDVWKKVTENGFSGLKSLGSC